MTINIRSSTSIRGNLSINQRNFQPISSGLITHLDASNINSYPQSGSVIYDLSGNNANGTMNGNVNWVNLGKRSYFNFPNGSTDTGFISSSVSQNYLDVTILFEPDFSFIAEANIIGLIGNNTPNSFQDKSLRFENANGTGPWVGRSSGNNDDWANTSTTFYRNGVIGLTLSNGWNTIGVYKTNQSSFPLNFSYYIGSSGYPGRSFQGKISAVLLYNRQLSESEQLENHNYLISRFL